MKARMQLLLTSALLIPLLQLPGVSQNKPATHVPPSYDVIDLGSPLGGFLAEAVSINRLGIIAGSGYLPTNYEHIFLYWGGITKDMGTIGGPNSGILGNFSGFSELDTLDPLGQLYCSYPGYICLPVTVQNGKTEVLPLLGGLNGQAWANNNTGEVVGDSQTTVKVDGCQQQPSIAQQIVPVFWEHGKVHALPMPSGDMEGEAYAVNDSGQIVGSTGDCTSNPAAHAVLWNKGKAINLGTFGGLMDNNANAINDSGDVTGGSDLAGDATFHAFLWHKGILTDLGTLPGDYSSTGVWINDSGEILGESCDINNNCRYFLWEHGTMTDLGTLLPANSPLVIQYLVMINDQGALVGYAYDPTTDNYPAVLLVPDYGRVSQQSSSDTAHPNFRIVVPPNDRLRSQRSMPGHFQSRVPER